MLLYKVLESLSTCIVIATHTRASERTRRRESERERERGGERERGAGGRTAQCLAARLSQRPSPLPPAQPLRYEV